MIVLTLATLVAGCETTAPSPPSPTTTFAAPLVSGLSLAAARDWLTEHTFSCGPSGRQSGFDVWACVQDNRVPPTDPKDLTVYRVELFVVGDGVHRVRASIDQSASASPNDDNARGFFASTVAGMITTIPPLEAFVLDRLETGGQTDFGNVRVVLSGSSTFRTLDLTAR